MNDRPDGEQFATWATREFDLTPAEVELVRQAQASIDLAHDLAASPTVRLAAMAGYRAALAALKLPTEDARHGNVEKTARPYPPPA